VSRRAILIQYRYGRSTRNRRYGPADASPSAALILQAVPDNQAGAVLSPPAATCQWPDSSVGQRGLGVLGSAVRSGRVRLGADSQASVITQVLRHLEFRTDLPEHRFGRR
jgi:hypothetical protein